MNYPLEFEANKNIVDHYFPYSMNIRLYEP